MAYQPEIEKLERRYADEPGKNFAQLAEAYRRSGRVDEALDLLLMHLEDRPNYVSALIVLGRCHLDQSQDQDAAAAFERVLAIDAENIIALKVLADIASREGNVDAARDWLQRLLEVDPMNEEAQEQLATLDAPPAGEPLAPQPVPADAADGTPMGFEPTLGDAEPAPGADEPLEIERASAEYDQPSMGDAAAPSDLDIEPSAEAELDAASMPDAADDVPAAESTGEALEAPPADPPTEEIPAVSAESSPPAMSETIVEQPAVRLPEDRTEDEDAAEPASGEPVAEEMPGPGEPEVEPAPVPAGSDQAADETLDAAPMEPAETGVDVEALAEAVEAVPPADEATEDVPAIEGADATLEIQPFDQELGWGTSERTSRQISEDDLAEAEAAHDEAVEGSPAHELPGLEAAEVPEPGDAHDAAPAEGFVPAELGPESAPDTIEPVEGLEQPDLAMPEPVAAAPDEPAPPDAAPWSDDTLVVEAEGEPEAEAGDRGSLTGLPVFLPDGDDPAEAEEPGPAGDVAEAEAPGAVDEEPIVTETMAELYARQGLVDEARAVYQQLLERRPDDEHLRARLAALEADLPAEPVAGEPEAPAASPDPRGRFAAAETGGVTARDFLIAVLEGRVTAGGATAAEPEAPSPMDEAFSDEPVEPRGAPTRPAGDEPSLSNLFGESRKASKPASPPKPQPGSAEGGFSFDEFFGESGADDAETPEEPEGGEGRRQPRLSVDDIDDSDESFKAWLKGLKS